MCDNCFRLLGDDEQMFGFKVVDDFEFIRGFKGHESCVQEMAEKFQQIYGKEDSEDGTNEENNQD